MNRFLKEFCQSLLVCSLIVLGTLCFGAFGYYMMVWFSWPGIIAAVVIITSFLSALFFTFLT